jgi:hypothetical protein
MEIPHAYYLTSLVKLFNDFKKFELALTGHKLTYKQDEDWTEARKLFYRKPTWWLISECKRLQIEPSNDDVSEKGKLVLALIRHRVMVSRNKRARAVSPNASSEASSNDYASSLNASSEASSNETPSSPNASSDASSAESESESTTGASRKRPFDYSPNIFFSPREGFCR